MSNPLPPGGIRQHLVQIVNAQENLSLDYQIAQFDSPVLVDGAVLDLLNPSLRNSRVVISQDASGGRPQTIVRLHYNRLNIPKLFTNRSTIFTADPVRTQLRQYLPELNQRLGTSLVANDIVDAVVNTDNGAAVVQLQGTPDTSLYVFGSISLTFIPPQGE
jgi:hypothetical protein